MANFCIDYLDKVTSAVEKALNQGHINDETAKGIECNYKRFALIIKKDKKEIVAALIAYTAFAEVYVDDIWVKPEHRGQNFGRMLIYTLEELFENQGYNNINLVTSDFQAPEFYKKCGFEVEFVRKNPHNPLLSKTFFIKYFKNTVQNQGIINDSKDL